MHVQLATRTKIFSISSAAFGGEPNAHTDPVCLGLPGALPVLNRAAVDAAVRLGLAVGSRIRPRCRFARKHYFYPDLPKGFQISQYDEPLCEGGAVSFRLGGEARQIRLTRIHMEDDAGKNIHDPSGVSFVDYNRAGRPAVRDRQRAGPPLRRGGRRVRARDSHAGPLSRDQRRQHGRGLAPLRRQRVASGRAAKASSAPRPSSRTSTRSRTCATPSSTRSRARRCCSTGARPWSRKPGYGIPTAASPPPCARRKQAHDYRYFPEPDLPPVVVDEDWLDRARAALPELPEARHARLLGLGLSAQDAVGAGGRAADRRLLRPGARGRAGPAQEARQLAHQRGAGARGRRAPVDGRRPTGAAGGAGGAGRAGRAGHALGQAGQGGLRPHVAGAPDARATSSPPSR